MAVQDYYRRIKDHEEYYQPVVELTHPHIRIVNVRVEARILTGHTQ